MEMVEMKTCRKCGDPKPISDFPIQKTNYFSKTRQETVYRETVRGLCKTCDAQYKKHRFQIRTANDNHVYQTLDLSKVDGPRGEVIKLLKNGFWITEVKDVAMPDRVERLVTDGNDDYKAVYPNTMKWLLKMGVIKEEPLRQRSTLLTEKKFILAKEYQNGGQEEHFTKTENLAAAR